MKILVWDRFVRLFHWGLAISFLSAYWFDNGQGLLHQCLGYTSLVLVAARVIWGFVGSKHARFADFVPGPNRLWHYMRAMLQWREPHYLGHNPAAAVMILFLLGMIISIGVTGWMMTLDAYWGNDNLQDLHLLLVNITLVAVAIHVTAAVYASLRHKENLIWSMISGHKHAPSTPDSSARSQRDNN
jgi:cytochrome b